MNFIWVVHEFAGGSILEAFESEADALSYLNWEEALGSILPGYYKVSKVPFTKELAK